MSEIKSKAEKVGLPIFYHRTKPSQCTGCSKCSLQHWPFYGVWIGPFRTFVVSLLRIALSQFPIVLSLFHSLVVLQSHCFAWPFRCFAHSIVLYFCCFVLSLFRTFAVSYFRCFAVSHFRCFIFSLFCTFVFRTLMWWLTQPPVTPGSTLQQRPWCGS